MAKEYVFHFEHYPHYLGTMNNETKLDIAVLDELSDRYIADNDDCTVYEDAEDALNGYAQMDIVRDWPKIRRALETKGEWGDMWEEGSHALSMNSLRDAKTIVGSIEAKIKMDEF